MTSVNLPRKVTEKLREIRISGEISYVFASSSSGEGMIGESWLLMTPVQMIVIVQPLVEDLKVAGRVSFSELHQIGVRRTFLGDLRFSFTAHGDTVLAEFEVPSIQSEEGEGLMQMFQKLFPGKVHQSREDVLDAVDVSGDTMMTVKVDYMKSVGDTVSGVQVDSIDIDTQLVQSGLSENASSLGDGNDQTVTIDVPVSQTIEVDTDSMVADPLSHSHDRERQKVQQSRQGKVPSVDLKGSKKGKKSGRTVPPPAPPPSSNSEEVVDCTRCGRSNQVSFQYCLGCGHQLPQPVEPPRGRKPANKVVGASTESGDDSDSGCGSCLGQLISFIVFLFLFQAVLSAVFK